MNDARTKKQQTDWTGNALLGLVLGSVLFCAALLAFPIWSAITQIASQQAGPQTRNDDLLMFVHCVS